MAGSTTASGSMMNTMVKAPSNGIIIRLNIRVISSMGKRLEMVYLSSMEISMKVNLSKDNFTETANTFSSRLGNNMKDNLLRIIFKVMAL